MFLLTISSITLVILSIVNAVCWGDPNFHQYGYIVSFLLVLIAFVQIPSLSRVYLKLSLLRILGEDEILSALIRQAKKLREAVNEVNSAEQALLQPGELLNEEKLSKIKAATAKETRLRRSFSAAHYTAGEICPNIKKKSYRDLLRQ